MASQTAPHIPYVLVPGDERPDDAGILVCKSDGCATGMASQTNSAKLKLSKREIASLSPASLGLTSEKIAKATGYRVNTVNNYLISAAKKLKAGNRTKAIADAIRRRLVA